MGSKEESRPRDKGGATSLLVSVCSQEKQTEEEPIVEIAKSVKDQQLVTDLESEDSSGDSDGETPSDRQKLPQRRNSSQIAKSMKDHQQVTDLESEDSSAGSDSETPLDRQILLEHPNSSQVGLCGRKQDSVLSEVNSKLEIFVKYFVKEFEAKLLCYQLFLEGEPKETDSFTYANSGLIGHGFGGVLAAVSGSFFSTFVGEAGKLAGAKLGKVIRDKKYSKEVAKAIDLVKLFLNDKASLRRELIKAGIDIFQSFEMQFVRVTTNLKENKALRLLAKDAVNRAVNYFGKNADTTISKAAVEGKSKIEPIKGVDLSIPGVKTPGFVVSYRYKSCEENWHTSSLYSKVGIVTELKGNISYYEKKDMGNKTEKYGYRRLLISENWENLKGAYKASDLTKSGQFTEYQYKINVADLEQKTEYILKEINRDDKDLKEDRLNQILKENKDEIMDLLKTQDKHIQVSLEEYFKTLNLLNFKVLLEAAKHELKEIVDVIEVGQHENRDNFKLLNQKQYDYHDNNIREHRETHEKLDRIESIIRPIQERSSINQSIYFSVTDPATLFTGRATELANLHTYIQRSSQKIAKISHITAISGLGGIGKTELARRYIQKYGNEYDGNIIWISAENKETLTESFTRLAEDKLLLKIQDINGKEKDIKWVIEKVYQFFESRKSLWIFDNADKNDNLKMFLPLRSVPPDAKKPYIVITSQDQEWDNGIEVVPLKELDKKEAEEFVKTGLKIVDSSQDKEIEALIKKLQCFPLAIQQAIAYLNFTGCTIEEYLNEYEKSADQLLNSEIFKDMVENDYAETTITTWKITVDKISADREHGELALKILYIIAYISPENINKKVFLSLVSGKEVKLRLIFRLLLRYSIVNGDKIHNIVSVHRLVQQVTRIELEAKGKRESAILDGFEVLRNSFPYEKNMSDDFLKKRELLPHLEMLLSHIDNSTEKMFDNINREENECLENLLAMIAEGYSAQGNLQKQKYILERVLSIHGTLYEEDCETAKILVKLGKVHGDLGDSHTKKELLEKALKIQDKFLDPEHYAIAKTLEDLSTAYGNLGDMKKQKDLLKRALSIQTKNYGSEHHEVAGILVKLGTAYGELGDIQSKKNLIEKAIKIQRNHYGEDHREVAVTLVNLGNAYGALGQPRKQKDLLETALKINEKNYGSNHFAVARALVNLGNAYGELGSHGKKKDLLEKALPIQIRHYGEDHYEIARTLINLGNASGALGNPKEQKYLLEKALKINEEYYGPDHCDVAVVLVNLGKVYGDLGDPRKQIEFLERALEINVSYYDKEHYRVGRTLVNLGNAHGFLGHPQKHKELLEQALKILEKHYGLEHHDVATTLFILSKAYESLNEPKQQQKLLERALKIQMQHFGSDHFEVAKTLTKLGTTLDNPAEQKDMIEKALVILETHYGTEHFEVAEALRNLGSAYGAMGNLQQQKCLTERALKIFQVHYGSEHYEVAKTLRILGSVFGALGESKKQKDMIERALKLLRNHYGPDHCEVCKTLNKIEDENSSALQEPQQQKDFVERALEILHYEQEHCEVAKTLRNLGIAYRTLEDDRELNIESS